LVLPGGAIFARNNPYPMKKRSFTILFLFLLTAVSIKAQQAGLLADTLQPVLIDTLPPDLFYAEFPAILKEHRERSMVDVANFAEKRKDYIIRTYARDKRFSKTITPILRKYNIPAELRLLVALESAYNPNAISGAGAVGYWQFMDEPAKEYGLTIITKQEREEAVKNKKTKKAVATNSKPAKKKTPQRDDRKHLVRSTYAAAKYLRDRSRNLNNNWLLIVASYNCGVGNVWEAMKKCGKTNPTFWDIKHLLPAETRNYVTNFINLSVILHNYKAFADGNLVFNSNPGNGSETVLISAASATTADKKK
jgi:hypothetical protein